MTGECGVTSTLVSDLGVLFADLVDYLPRTYDLPPQEAVSLLNPLLCEMIASIAEYDGEVVRCFGDGILAVFGGGDAPIASARAVNAAIRLHKRVSARRFAARCGVTWGAVYFGEIGSEVYREISAIGSCVDLAARLQKAAGPGETMCSESIYDFTSHLARWREQEVLIKGLSQPVRAYLLGQEDGAMNREH